MSHDGTCLEYRAEAGALRPLLSRRRRPARRACATSRRPARPRHDAAALGARLPAIARGTSRAPAEVRGLADATAREAASLRRADLPVHLRRRRKAGTRASATSNSSRSSVRRSGGDRSATSAGRIFASSATNIRCCTRPRRCSRRPAREGFLLDCAYPMHRARPPARDELQGGPALSRLLARRRSGAWWWEQHRHLADLGIEGWWLDGGEGPPASAAARRRAGDVLHNRYDLLRQQAFAEGEASDNPDAPSVPALPLGRPGHAALRRGRWSGDINNDLRDARDADPHRPQCRHVRRAALGHRYRRLLPGGAATRASCSCAGSSSARSARSSARMATCGAGICPGRYGDGDRGDLPTLSRAALPADALHLHARLAGASRRACR